MIQISLPDGSKRSFDCPLSVLQLAREISLSLSKEVIAAKINGTLCDTSFLINTDCEVVIITAKDPLGLEIIRHSTAHLLAYAVKTLFPEVQITIGPVIESGFYYDFAYHRSFTPDDLICIENKMHELAKKNEQVVRTVMSRKQALDYFSKIGQLYKLEIISELDEKEVISLYGHGQFTDLCRGPHVPSTGRLKAFKLLRVAGAYWRGDSNNVMLQRIYGTAFATNEDLEVYLYQISEAEKRDHRKLAKQLDLFHFQEEAPGLVFWHPKGWILWQQIEQYMRSVYQDNDYQEVRSPQILDRSLWEKSGHWDNYKDNMFCTQSENRSYAVKPMNCPGHIQIFNANLHSYRDLPVRYGEFGFCHRNEPSGSLHGVMRARGFVQDDGHIFCLEEQIQSEVTYFDAVVRKVYADFGFTQIAVKLALRPKQRVGSDLVWDKAEHALRMALTDSKCSWDELPGEGAFYGPKIEYHLKDSIGRSWQLGTMQVDFSMPERLGAEYVSKKNERQIPVMLHRAVLGSLERFIGLLIENYAGSLPLWLAPEQLVILNVGSIHEIYAIEVLHDLKAQGLRAKTDLRNEKIAYKIRDHSMQKVPYIIIVGDKEIASKTVAVRAKGIELPPLSIGVLIERLLAEIAAKAN